MKKARLADARILVAGGSGDIGELVIKALKAQGAVCFPTSRRTGFDLRNESEALTATLYARPDVIVHLGASSGLRVPGQTFRDNLAMGTNLVHAAAAANAQIVVLGSYHAYQSSDGLNSEEDFWKGTPAGPYAPLGTAQRAIEAMCRFYRAQHGLRYAFLVAPAMYGRHMSKQGNAVDKVISDLALSLDTGKLLEPLSGSPDTKMSMLHISDVADAIVAAVGAINHEGPLNLASEEVHSLGTIAQTAAKALGVPAEEIKFDGNALPGIILDGDRGREALAWEPKISDTDGVCAEAAILKNLMECGSQPAPAAK